MMETWDVIIVGSGCTGAMAAQTLVEAGWKVLIVDAGISSDPRSSFPNSDLASIRQTEENQERFFLGENFEGIPLGKVKVGEHLSVPRKFIVAETEKFIPLLSETFKPLESLALGGLGNGWGLGSCVFSDTELAACGLPIEKMKQAYQTVSDRIGLSGENDDAAHYTAAKLKDIQPAIKMDSVGKNLFENYAKKKSRLNKKGFYLGRPTLALLSADKGSRKAYQYRDLDFYDDQDQSAYRPWITIDLLKGESNFCYQGNLLALQFSESGNETTLQCMRLDNQEKVSFQTKKLILCAGVLGTSRIVLRSFQAYGKKLPILCNSYSYLPAIQPFLLGKDIDKNKIGFAQLSLFQDALKTNMDVPMASIYSYRSMLYFHVLKETPLGIKDSFRFLQFMLPAFTIIGLFHPEKYGEEKFLFLEKSNQTLTNDLLKVNYQLSEQEKLQIQKTEHSFKNTLAILNCFVLKKIAPEMGASIHYGGSLPFSNEAKKFTLSVEGKLAETENVYVADGSGFKYLPGKGLTLSLMAYAHFVALKLSGK